MSLDLTITKNRSKSGFGKVTFKNKRGENMPIVNGIPVNPPKPRRSQSASQPPPARTPSRTTTLPRPLPANYNNQRTTQWVNRNDSQTPAYVNNYQRTKPTPTVQQPVNPIGNVGIQNQLNETTFRQYLDGFVEITRADLPITPGGRLRYALDSISGGRVVSTLYRLGGFVKSVSPDLSSVTLFNPFVNKSWTFKTVQPGKRVRLYFFKRPTSDEGAAMRALVNKLQNGQVRLVRNY